jgi:hypothetical protein
MPHPAPSYQRHRLPALLKQLSTRHLDIAEKRPDLVRLPMGRPAQRAAAARRLFAKGEDLSFVSLPEETTVRLGNYVGAIAVNRRDNVVGLTSPVGGAAVTLDAKTGAVVKEETVREAAGVAPAIHGIAVSSYDGQFNETRSQVAWDQHIVRLG